MKNLKNILFISILFASLTLSFTSCKKDKDLPAPIISDNNINNGNNGGGGNDPIDNSIFCTDNGPYVYVTFNDRPRIGGTTKDFYDFTQGFRNIETSFCDYDQNDLEKIRERQSLFDNFGSYSWMDNRGLPISFIPLSVINSYNNQYPQRIPIITNSVGDHDYSGIPLGFQFRTTNDNTVGDGGNGIYDPTMQESYLQFDNIYEDTRLIFDNNNILKPVNQVLFESGSNLRWYIMKGYARIKYTETDFALFEFYLYIYVDSNV